MSENNSPPKELIQINDLFNEFEPTTMNVSNSMFEDLQPKAGDIIDKNKQNEHDLEERRAEDELDKITDKQKSDSMNFDKLFRNT